MKQQNQIAPPVIAGSSDWQLTCTPWTALRSAAIRVLIMDGSGFIQGVWCGAIFGAAIMMLIVSLIFESSQRRQERQARRVYKIWGEGLSVATVLAQTHAEQVTDYRGQASA